MKWSQVQAFCHLIRNVVKETQEGWQSLGFVLDHCGLSISIKSLLTSPIVPSLNSCRKQWMNLDNNSIKGETFCFFLRTFWLIIVGSLKLGNEYFNFIIQIRRLSCQTDNALQFVSVAFRSQSIDLAGNQISAPSYCTFRLRELKKSRKLSSSTFSMFNEDSKIQ